MIDYRIQDPLAQPTQSNIIALPRHVTLHLTHTPYRRQSVPLLVYIYTTHIVYSHIVYADCRRFSLSLRGVIISLCRYFHVLRTGARLFAKIASKWNAGAMWHAAIYFHLRLRLRAATPTPAVAVAAGALSLFNCRQTAPKVEHRKPNCLLHFA